MDPNATLAELREVFGSEDEPCNNPYEMQERFERARELFDALDGWLMGGGFKPEAWK